MRAVLLLTALLVAVPAFAKVAPRKKALPLPSDLKIITEFDFELQSRDVETRTSAIFSRANHNWTTISGSEGGIVLQARVVSSSDKDVRMEYQVLDGRNNNQVLARPAMVALFGEKAAIESKELNGAKVKISLLANPVK